MNRFVWSVVLLGFVNQCGAMEIPVSDFQSRVENEAKACWARVDLCRENVDITGKYRSKQLANSSVEEVCFRLRDRAANVLLERIDLATYDSLQRQTGERVQGLSEGTEHVLSAFGSNGTYDFQVRHAEGNTFNQVNLNVGEVRENRGFSLMIGYPALFASEAASTVLSVPLTELFSNPRLTISKVESIQGEDGSEQLKVSFFLSQPIPAGGLFGEATQGAVQMKGGEIMLNPSLGWSVASANIDCAVSEQGEHAIKWRSEGKYSMVDGIPFGVSGSVPVTEEASVEFAGVKHDVDIKGFTYEAPPEEVFKLTRYGIPEPAVFGNDSQLARRMTMVLLSVVVAFVIFGGLAFRRMASKRKPG